nr:phosphopantothenoylcysteine decarboxylase [Desulfosarcina cetonica]
METYARQKVVAKHLDMIAANLIGPPDSGFSADTNRMTLFFADGRKTVLDVMDKDDVAHHILDEVVAMIRGAKTAPAGD